MHCHPYTGQTRCLALVYHPSADIVGSLGRSEGHPMGPGLSCRLQPAMTCICVAASLSVWFDPVYCAGGPACVHKCEDSHTGIVPSGATTYQVQAALVAYELTHPMIGTITNDLTNTGQTFQLLIIPWRPRTGRTGLRKPNGCIFVSKCTACSEVCIAHLSWKAGMVSS